MLTHDLHEKIKQYISIYAELKPKLKWKVSHDQILMLISSAYIVNKREFDFQRFYDLSSYIKSTSAASQHSIHTTALLLHLFWTFIFSMRQNKHFILLSMYTMKW